MSKTWEYRSGDWNCICDVCSIKIKASKTKQRWDGLVVCPNCFEHRHSQDFIKVRQDKITVPFTRPRPTDIFTNVTYINTGDSLCTPSGIQAIPAQAIPGCMIPNKNNSGL